MSQWLITPSLLNSFDYYFSFEGEPSGEGEDFVSAEQKEAEVRREFLQTLSREKSPPNESMQAGIDFENKVRAYCDGLCLEVTPVIREIGDIVKGGGWQVTMKKPMGDYLLYAKADNVFRDTIYDLKRSNSYEVGKYQKSMQHRIEFYCSGMPKFSYLVTDDRAWWREDYANHDGIGLEIAASIQKFTGYLRHDPEARELYYGKWAALKEAA